MRNLKVVVHLHILKDFKCVHSYKDDMHLIPIKLKDW